MMVANQIQTGRLDELVPDKREEHKKQLADANLKLAVQLMELQKKG